MRVSYFLSPPPPHQNESDFFTPPIINATPPPSKKKGSQDCPYLTSDLNMNMDPHLVTLAGGISSDYSILYNCFCAVISECRLILCSVAHCKKINKMFV